MPKEKFKINQYYNLLNKAQQEQLRAEYKKHIGLAKAQFYNDLKSENLTADKIFFFSRIFGVPMEDLFNEVSEVPGPVINLSLILGIENAIPSYR